RSEGVGLIPRSRLLVTLCRLGGMCRRQPVRDFSEARGGSWLSGETELSWRVASPVPTLPDTEAYVAEKKTETAGAQQEMARTEGGKQLSKTEMGRRVRGDMGPNTKPSAIQPETQKRFGVLMSTGHSAPCKGDRMKKGRLGGKAKKRRAKK